MTAKLNWRWGRGGDPTMGYLGSAINPVAMVFPSGAARSAGSRYNWVTMVEGQAVASSLHPSDAQKLARAILADARRRS